MLRLFSHFKPFFATSFFFLTFFRPCMYRRSALSYFRSGLPYAAASLQCARYDTKVKKIQIWQDFKGRGLKSQSLKGLAFIKGEITAIHQQIMYSCLYRVQNFEILTAKLIYCGGVPKYCPLIMRSIFAFQNSNNPFWIRIKSDLFFLLFFFSRNSKSSKGQFISKCLFCAIIRTKIAMKILSRFLP